MGMFDFVGDAVDWVGGALGTAGDTISGNTRARVTAYDPAQITAAQQPWLSSLATAAGETPEVAAQQAMASDRERLLAEAAAINPTATRDQLVGVGNQFGVDTRRQAGGIESLASELGSAPSYADQASRAAMDRQSAEAIGRAASARGPNAALQLREAAGMNAGAARMAASDAGAMKAKEMSDRYGQRAGMLGQAAGVTATGAAGQGNLYGAAGSAELAARDSRAGMTQSAGQMAEASGQLGLAGQQNRTSAASAGGQIATSGQSIAAGSHDAANAENQATNRENSANRKDTAGGLMQAAGGALLMGLGSDIRMKEDVEPMADFGLADAMERYEAKNAARKDVKSDGGSSAMGEGLLMQGLSMLSDNEAKRDAKLAGKLELLAALDDGERSAISEMAKPERSSRLARAAGEPDMSTAKGRMLNDLYVAEVDGTDYLGEEAHQAYGAPLRERASYPTPRQPEFRAMADDPEANREALAPMKPYTFRYKPAAARAMGTDTEPRPGIMAQQMERSPAGREVVSENDDGMKELDLRKATGFTLAGVAGLDKRLSRLEKLKAAAGER